MNKFNILAGLVGILTVFTGYLFLSNQISNVVNVGTELPDAPALFETSLAAPITATADSFTLTANSVRGGGSLSGYNCFTIDEGSAQAEFVCGTASSTSVTGVTRGISPSDGTSAVSALQFAHRRGASVKITDFPIIQIIRNQNNGEATFENALRYAGSVVPSGADDLADVGYVLSVVNGGTVNFDALVVAGRAGETVATGTLVYFNGADQEWYKVDTDDTNTFQNVAVGLTRGNGATAGTIGGGGVLLKGLQTGLSGLTAGGTYYASSSAGNFNTATSVLPIGQAKSTTELMFDPVMIDVVREGYNNTFSGTNIFNGNTTFTGTTTFTGGKVGFVDVQSFTSSSTWVKPAFGTLAFVEVIGAGGSGAAVKDNTDNAHAAGGSGGAYRQFTIKLSDLSATETVNIGTGGASRTANSDGTVTVGAVGGVSWFKSTTFQANGGLAGGGTISASPASTPSVAGGAAATVFISEIGASSGGASGNPASAGTGSSGVYSGAGGGGGSTYSGATATGTGGVSLFLGSIGGTGAATVGAVTATATAGAKGGGGGGSAVTNSAAIAVSGAGGDGFVRVTVY
jgi:hypothetical protein